MKQSRERGTEQLSPHETALANLGSAAPLFSLFSFGRGREGVSGAGLVRKETADIFSRRPFSDLNHLRPFLYITLIPASPDLRLQLSAPPTPAASSPFPVRCFGLLFSQKCLPTAGSTPVTFAYASLFWLHRVLCGDYGEFAAGVIFRSIAFVSFDFPACLLCFGVCGSVWTQIAPPAGLFCRVRFHRGRSSADEGGWCFLRVIRAVRLMCDRVLFASVLFPLFLWCGASAGSRSGLLVSFCSCLVLDGTSPSVWLPLGVLCWVSAVVFL